jgi:hypothetical protein
MKLPGLHWFRRRQRSLARVVLALFCLTWLQLATAPCVMALEQRAANPQHSAQMPDGMEMSAGEHCPYCPPAPVGDADCDHSSCAFPHDPQVDSRIGFIAALLAPPTPVAMLVPHVADMTHWLIAAAPPPLPHASLTVSLCRYLR